MKQTFRSWRRPNNLMHDFVRNTPWPVVLSCGYEWLAPIELSETAGWSFRLYDRESDRATWRNVPDSALQPDNFAKTVATTLAELAIHMERPT